MKTICYYCKNQISETSELADKISHGICNRCLRDKHNSVYRAARDAKAMARGEKLLKDLIPGYARFVTPSLKRRGI